MLNEQRRLRRRERNAVHAEIEGLNLNPADYVWAQRFDSSSTSIGVTIESLEHERSGSYFAIGVAPDGTYYYGECDPGESAQVDRLGGLTWPEMIRHVRTWLRSVEREASEPDRWAEIGKAREEFVSMLDAGVSLDSPLSAEEQTRIAEHVRSIHEAITRNHELSSEQLAILERRLAELKSASKRLTRKDFLNYAIGAMVGLALELSLPGDLATGLLRSTISLVTTIFGGFAELPPPAPG